MIKDLKRICYPFIAFFAAWVICGYSLGTLWGETAWDTANHNIFSSSIDASELTSYDVWDTTIVSVELKDGKLEVVKRATLIDSWIWWGGIERAKAWKEIYAAKDKRIVVEIDSTAELICWFPADEDGRDMDTVGWSYDTTVTYQPIIYLEKIIRGHIIPARTLPERIEFGDEKEAMPR